MQKQFAINVKKKSTIKLTIKNVFKNNCLANSFLYFNFYMLIVLVITEYVVLSQ